jgi:hypothetical protein
MSVPLRLTAARAAAWALLLAGWVGLGALALARSTDAVAACALVAAWLLALGLAAIVATHDDLQPWTRRGGLLVSAAVTAAALLHAGSDGGWTSLLVALAGWAALTALASGVVRSNRLAQVASPSPPVVAASLGAACAALALVDLGDPAVLAIRLAVLVVFVALGLAVLQPRDRPRGAPSRCRAGLFDCSLPAWPRGAWHDVCQWPVLLSGLAMLPMMAALPAMAVLWCRGTAVPPYAVVGLHFAAMFMPAVLLRSTVSRWSSRRLATICTALLAIGAATVLWAPTPIDMLGVTLAQGAAWSLAWTGQLWSPQRRGRESASPLRAAIGYAMLTLAVGVAVDRLGPVGFTLAHALLGALALLAWLYGAFVRRTIAAS